MVLYDRAGNSKTEASGSAFRAAEDGEEPALTQTFVSA